MDRIYHFLGFVFGQLKIFNQIFTFKYWKLLFFCLRSPNRYQNDFIAST